MWICIDLDIHGVRVFKGTGRHAYGETEVKDGMPRTR